MKFQAVMLPVDALEICGRIRVRNQKPKDGSDLVLEYAQAYEAGQILEPLDVFREKGTERYIVIDGEHRLLALRRLKRKEIECRVREGDEVDALRFGMGCNWKHGLRRTAADTYHLFTLLKETPRLDEEFRTDQQISELIGISVPTVTRYKLKWRESEGGSTRIRAKKEKAQAKAKKHTPTKIANSSRDEFHEAQNQSLTSNKLASEPQEKPKTARDASAAIDTSEKSKKPNGAAGQWTDADEKSYQKLCDDWDRSTRPAQLRFLMDHR